MGSILKEFARGNSISSIHYRQRRMRGNLLNYYRTTVWCMATACYAIGIKFAEHESHGIDAQDFAELLTVCSSG